SHPDAVSRRRGRAQGVQTPAMPEMYTSHGRGPAAEIRRIRGRGCAYLACVVAAILLGRPFASFAQDVTEPALKAAFIYNFAKFTEWPDELLPARAPFTICVLGDAAVADAVERLSRNRMFSGRAIRVFRAADSSTLPGCQVLYLSKVPAAKAAVALAGARNVPVLTLSDNEGFMAAGGIAELYFEHGQLRFDVDLEAVKRSHLQISSRLLALAKKR
ncbi:MAG: YfiR family protein, partial [Vicinamibacterales bacterium]